MKRISTLILLLSLGLPAGLSASQESASEIPITISADAAHETFLEWAGSLDERLPYPAQLHMDMVGTFEVDEGAGGMTMEMDMDFDLLLDSPSEMRTWGGLKMKMAGAGMDMDIHFDVQLASDRNGLRFLLDDHGFLEDTLDTSLPKAFQLSADRADILAKMYMDFLLESMEMHGPEAVAAFRQMGGLTEMMHPATAPRIMLTAQGMDIIGWGALDGKARIQSRLKTETLKQALGGQALPFDLSAFDDMVFEMVVDLETGEMLHYLVEMDLPMSGPASGGSALGMNMKMRIEMGSVEPSADAPSVALPAAGEVMVLDEYFDQFLPMIELAMEMQRQQMRAMQGETESEDDFDF